MRDLARRLLAYESVPGENSVPTEAATLRVHEKLRRHLASLAGVAGFQSLASRALALARAEAPSLYRVQVLTDGSLQHLEELEPLTDRHQNGEEGIILIAQLLGLLNTFIGTALTLRLLKDIWPDAAFDNFISRDGRNCETTR